MGKTSLRCPVCGASVPVVRTMVVPSQHGERCKDIPIACVRYQHLVCKECGTSGDRAIFVGCAVWEDAEMQDYTEVCRPETILQTTSS